MKRCTLLILSLCTIRVFSIDEVKVPNRKEVFQLRRKASECAAEMEDAIDCGAKVAKPSCCPGLICHKYQTFRCVKKENYSCAGEGTVSKECGSTWNKATPKCCAGLKCIDRYCLSDDFVSQVLEQITDKPTSPPTLPPPTLPPTPSPTMSPTKKTTYRVKVKVGCLSNICRVDGKTKDNLSDPFIRVFVGNKDKKTNVKNAASGKHCWNKTYDFGYQDVDKYGKINVNFKVVDEDKSASNNDLMGKLYVSTSETISGEKKLDSKGSKDEKNCGKTKLSYTIELL